MAITNSDIKLYMTSIEPAIAQDSPSQSIGGYPSTTLVYPETTLSSTVGLYGVTLPGATTESEYASVNMELMRMSTETAGLIVGRAVNSSRGSHLVDSMIRATNPRLFNKDFNSLLKQYRCVAVKNTGGLGDTAYSMGVYIKRTSANPHSSVRIAVEIPRSDYLSAKTATGGTAITLIDSSLGETYADNFFADARLTFTSGDNINQSVVITSYDKASRTFVFANSLPHTVIAGNGYVIEPSPSQRISTGIVAPATGNPLVSDFRIPGFYDAIPLNLSGTRTNGNDFCPNDVFYVWIERTVDKNSQDFTANTFSLGFTYLASV